MVLFFDVVPSNLLRPALSRGETRRFPFDLERLLLIVRRIDRLATRTLETVRLRARLRGLGVTNSTRLAPILKLWDTKLHAEEPA